MKNVKKFVSLCLIMIMTFAVFALAGCGKEPHTHAYGAEYYTVSSDKTKAYKTKTCACGHSVNIKIENAVIVNPTNAQAELDKNINGKTIVFDEGVYGDLIMRPTRETVEGIYAYDPENPTVKGAEVNLADVDTTKTTKGYHYDRTLENIVFAGTKNAQFKGLFTFESGNVGGAEGTNDTAYFTDKSRLGLAENRKDVIRNLELTTTNSAYGWTDICYSAHVDMDKLSFDRMNFNGKYGRIYFYEGKVDSVQKNISITNCKFETDEAYKSGHEYYDFDAPAVAIYTRSTGFYENITFKNNTIVGHFQGLVVLNGKNVYVEENAISGTEHNALAFHGASTLTNGAKNTYTTGNIVIKNNSIKNIGVGVATGERAFRFANLTDAKVSITGNSFENCAEDRTGKKPTSQGKQLLATETVSETVEGASSFVFENNTYKGKSMTLKKDGNKYIVYTELPVTE